MKTPQEMEDRQDTDDTDNAETIPKEWPRWKSWMTERQTHADDDEHRDANDLQRRQLVDV